MKNSMAIAIGTACGFIAGFLGAGLLFLLTRQPQGKPITLYPPPTSAPYKIYVSGAVYNPGVYDMPPGSRMQDAISHAGGFLPDANTQKLNLAASLNDGMQINVPFSPSASQVKTGGNIEAGTVQVFPLDINTASLEELDKLPDIGPSTAQRIIDYRNENGRFEDIQDIEKVPGIGPVTFEKIKDLISIQ